MLRCPADPWTRTVVILLALLSIWCMYGFMQCRPYPADAIFNNQLRITELLHETQQLRGENADLVERVITLERDRIVLLLRIESLEDAAG